jgi:hypothetical protein
MAWADVLLTLDRGDFETLLGTSFYGLPILTPGAFLRRERDSGRLTKLDVSALQMNRLGSLCHISHLLHQTAARVRYRS